MRKESESKNNNKLEYIKPEIIKHEILETRTGGTSCSA